MAESIPGPLLSANSISAYTPAPAGKKAGLPELEYASRCCYHFRALGCCSPVPCRSFNLPFTKDKVLRDLGDGVPSIFKRFYSSRLYDKLLSTFILYFVAVFQKDNLKKVFIREAVGLVVMASMHRSARSTTEQLRATKPHMPFLHIHRVITRPLPKLPARTGQCSAVLPPCYKHDASCSATDTAFQQNHTSAAAQTLCALLMEPNCKCRHLKGLPLGWRLVGQTLRPWPLSTLQPPRSVADVLRPPPHLTFTLLAADAGRHFQPLLLRRPLPLPHLPPPAAAAHRSTARTLLQALERAKKLQDGVSPASLQVQLADLEREVVAHRLEVGPLYAEILMKHANHQKPQHDR
jgi:hypothetical protein